MTATLTRAPGFSDAASFIEASTQKRRQRMHETNTLGIEPVLDELATVWAECREPNWDGFEAFPVSRDTRYNASLFLESLPPGFPRPSIGAEPDGHLTLEWYRSARRTLSISVDPDGNLHYAALSGPSRDFGTRPFFGEVPEDILSLIERVYST